MNTNSLQNTLQKLSKVAIMQIVFGILVFGWNAATLLTGLSAQSEVIEGYLQATTLSLMMASLGFWMGLSGYQKQKSIKLFHTYHDALQGRAATLHDDYSAIAREMSITERKATLDVALLKKYRLWEHA